MGHGQGDIDTIAGDVQADERDRGLAATLARAELVKSRGIACTCQTNDRLVEDAQEVIGMPISGEAARGRIIRETCTPLRSSFLIAEGRSSGRQLRETIRRGCARDDDLFGCE